MTITAIPTLREQLSDKWFDAVETTVGELKTQVDTNTTTIGTHTSTLATIATAKIASGVLVTGVSLLTTRTEITHTLGRTPVGFVIADCTKNVVAWRDTAEGAVRSATHLDIIGSDTDTVSVYIW